MPKCGVICSRVHVIFKGECMYRNLTIEEGHREVMIAFNSLPISSVVLDANYKLVDVNNRALELFNLGRKDLVEAQKVIDQNEGIAALVDDLSVGKDVFMRSSVIQLPDGGAIPVTLNASMLYGNPKLFLFLFY
ncbi:MAG: hypothetical protein RIS29_1824 [Bacteroidota bacterium]